MKMLRMVSLIATLTVVGAIAAVAADADRLDTDVQDSVHLFRNNQRLARLFDSAYGYAIFPSVGKAAIGIGGAEGRGQVFEKGALIGTAKLMQATVGAQLGAQSYSEVIFFETLPALDEFRDGKTALSAALSGADCSGWRWRRGEIPAWRARVHHGQVGPDVRGQRRWTALQVPGTKQCGTCANANGSSGNAGAVFNAASGTINTTGTGAAAIVSWL